MGEMPQADGLVEVATRSQSSATPTFAHIPVVDAYKDEQYCMAHIPLNPQPNTGETYSSVSQYIDCPQQHLCSTTCSIPPIHLFLCSSQIRTDQWEDQESVSNVEGAKGVSQSEEVL